MLYNVNYDKFGTLIKIDIDKPKISLFTMVSLKYISQHYTIKKLTIATSPSKRGYHLVICLKEVLPDTEIIALQFMCGSDRKRERFNMLRYMKGLSMRQWNLLFPNKINRKIKGTNLKIKAIAHHKKPL